MLPITVGTSSSKKRIFDPKHYASTDKSIKLTAARASVRFAIYFIPIACLSLSEMRSITLIPIICAAGKKRIGIVWSSLLISCTLRGHR